MSEDKKYKMHDTSIAGMMQLLQLAMLTQTDVTDHFRAMEFYVDDDGRLVMSDEFIKATKAFADTMVKRAEQLAEELERGEASGVDVFKFND